MTGVREAQVWQSLRDAEYRKEFSSDVGTGLAFQIRLLRERKGWTQEQLAALTGKQQETISQWENPGYGSYTLNSLKSLASAFDVALVVKFAPFSELVDWTVNLTPQRLAPDSFDAEDASRARQVLAQRWLTAPTLADFSDFDLRIDAVAGTGIVASPRPQLQTDNIEASFKPRHERLEIPDAA